MNTIAARDLIDAYEALGKAMKMLTHEQCEGADIFRVRAKLWVSFFDLPDFKVAEEERKKEEQEAA